jgi:hypothetical protein
MPEAIELPEPEYFGTSVRCPVCKTVSDNTANFCFRCGYLLNKEEFQEMIGHAIDDWIKNHYKFWMTGEIDEETQPS